jgi:hypothetical protein
MSDAERDLCAFRQMEAAAESGGVFDLSPELTPDDVVCGVGSCALTLGHLVDYVTAAGAAEPRNALDSVVAPCCTMLDVPHDADRELGDAWEQIFLPPEEG